MKTLSLTIMVVGLLGLMAYTNPSLDDYENYINQSIIKETQKQHDPLQALIGSFFGGIASSVLAKQTVRQDYIFLSTYDTKLGRERLRAVGIFRQFYRYETPAEMEGKF